MNPNDPIKWDKSKKEARDQANADRDRVEKENECKSLIAGAYAKWKRQLTRKPKTAQEVTAALYELMAIVSENSKHLSDEWKAFTIQLLEDKIGQTVTLEITERNQIMPYVPDIAYKGDEVDAIAKHNALHGIKPVVFRTQEELEQLSFVAAVMAKEGFAGLVIDGAFLCGLFEDGEFLKIGVLTNAVGTTKYPRAKEIHDALAATEAAKSGAAADSTATPGKRTGRTGARSTPPKPRGGDPSTW